MKKNWVSDGISKAVATIQKVGLHEAPFLSLPPLSPVLVEIETVHQPGDYTFKFSVPVDPTLNVHRHPSSFAVLAKRSDQSSYTQIATVAGDARSIRANTSAMGSGLWNYIVRAVNQNGVADSAPYLMPW